VRKRQCDVEHTRFGATESWRAECDGGLAQTAVGHDVPTADFPRRSSVALDRSFQRTNALSESFALARSGLSLLASELSLINKSAEELDSVRIWPLIETLASASDRVEESRDLHVN
jgi:hypothetical protein